LTPETAAGRKRWSRLVRHLRALNAYLHGDEYDEVNLSEGELK